VLRQTGPVDGSASPRPIAWLLLIYRIPSEPTKLRATVWRRLKGVGAVYLQTSTAALPASPTAERSLRRLRHEILEMGGSALLLECSALAGEPEIVSAFEAARNDEYEEIADRCEDFLRQVQKEHDASHFTYAELEENEVDLAKLRSWMAKVVDRDVFGSSGRPVTEKLLERCAEALEGYAAEVYARDADAH
jgi:hypothetical protein